MSDDYQPLVYHIDGVTHLGGSHVIQGRTTCGMLVYDRSLDAILQMHLAGVGKDVNCMTCLVVEARRKP